MKKNLLSIAGYDPSGGAGVILDIGVFEHLGFQGAGILTAVTAQNTRFVSGVYCLPPAFLFKQFQTLAADLEISGIKVGMLGSGKALTALDKILRASAGLPIVVDPVFVSSSGRWLIEKSSIRGYLRAIRSKASLITPNLDEAAQICGFRPENLSGMKEAARRIYVITGIPCLVKGGHLKKSAADLLFDGKGFETFKHRKLSKKVHGTGCFLSSSILAYLAKHLSLGEACFQATELTHQAIRNAIRPGKGRHVISLPI